MIVNSYLNGGDRSSVVMEWDEMCVAGGLLDGWFIKLLSFSLYMSA